MEKPWLSLYPAKVPATITVDPQRSLRDYLDQQCHEFASHVAFQNFSKQLTYAEFDRLSTRFAAYLQHGLRLKKGDRFAIMLPNVLQFPIAMFAAIKAGVIIVNINPLYTARELIVQLNDSGASAIIVLENFARTLSEALPMTQVSHVIVTKPGDCLDFKERCLSWLIAKVIKRTIPPWEIASAISFSDAMLAAHSMHYDRVPLQGNDIAFLQYTGGTTGTVKAAVLTHTNVLANVQQCLAWVRSKLHYGSDTVITALPLYHIFSLMGCLFFMGVGAKALLISNPRNYGLFIKTLQKNRFSIFVGLNTMFNSLMRQDGFKAIDFSALSLVISGGMALQKAVAERWQAMTGVVIVEGYGLTEASPVVTINPVNITEFTGSIGVPISSTDLQIRNKQGEVMPTGEYGEIWVSGPQVMQGYWQNPSETAQVIDAAGWLRTGDIGYVDARGMVYVVDREKDMIIVSGFNVYPNEIEEVIASHPDVKEVAVVGVPSTKTGEAVKAFVVADERVTAKEIIDFCHERLTHYKVPRSIEFMRELPKSTVGKVLRRELRQRTH